MALLVFMHCICWQRAAKCLQTFKLDWCSLGIFASIYPSPKISTRSNVCIAVLYCFVVASTHVISLINTHACTGKLHTCVRYWWAFCSLGVLLFSRRRSVGMISKYRAWYLNKSCLQHACLWFCSTRYVAGIHHILKQSAQIMDISSRENVFDVYPF